MLVTNNIWNKSYLDLRVISNELILAGKLQLKKLLITRRSNMIYFIYYLW